MVVVLLASVLLEGSVKLEIFYGLVVTRDLLNITTAYPYVTVTMAVQIRSPSCVIRMI